MPTTPRVSVVCPCYNAERFIAGTIDSVRSQVFDAWEMIVVDDGCTDDSAAVVTALAERDPRLRLVRQSNHGVARARNVGVEHSSETEFLLFLDADDRLQASMLDRLVTYLDSEKGVGAVYCGQRYIDDFGEPIDLDIPRLQPRVARGRWWVRRIPDHDPVTPFESIFCASGMTPSLTLMRRSVYAQTDGWDESFGQPCEDDHLFLQLALAAPVHRVTDRLVDYRVHAAQNTADVVRLKRQMNKLGARWSEYEHLPPTQRETVRRAWLFRERQNMTATAVRRVVYELRHRHPYAALRFGGGASRIVLRSLLAGPPPRRRI